MKCKIKLKIFLFIMVFIYLFAGIYFFMFYGNKEGKQHLEKSEGQEIALEMQKAEQHAQEETNLIFRQIKDGTIEKNTILLEIETAKNYLQQNFKEVSPENENYIELLYYSAFLMILGENFDDELTRTSKQIHSYIVDSLYEDPSDEMECKLIEQLQGLENEVVERWVDELYCSS